MAVAKIIEITATSDTSFEDAVQRGIEKAGESLHGIKGAWIDGQKVLIENGKIVGYRVNLKVTFILD